jgi:hypothetical protein
MGEGVPDGRTASVLGGGTFDLVGGGCRPPEEVVRKADRGHDDLRSRKFANMRVVIEVE